MANEFRKYERMCPLFLVQVRTPISELFKGNPYFDMSACRIANVFAKGIFDKRKREDG